MSFTLLSRPQRLAFIREAIRIVETDAVVNAAMVAKGYTPERLSEGLGLQETAESFTQAREVNYGSGIEATSIVNDLQKKIRGFFSSHRKLAREAFKGQSGQYEKLTLVTPIPASREKLVQSTRHFYTQIAEQPDLLAGVTPYGLTGAVAEERLAEIASLEAAMQSQQIQRAEAEVMTRKRQAAMEAFDEWSLEFLGTARLVFKKEKAQLKKLGLPIVIRSKTKGQEEEEKAEGGEAESGEGEAAGEPSVTE